MPSDPKLVVALEARLDKFEKQLKDAGVIADRQVRDIEDKFNKANPSFGAAFLRNFAIAAAGAFSLDRAFDAVIKSIGDLAKIDDVSQAVGLTAEQVQELRFALEQSGGSASQADSAMERFSNNVAKASQESGYLKQLLDANNISLKDQSGNLRSTGDLLAVVANLIKNAKSPQEQMNIAAEAFGRSAAPSMVRALKDGAEGLQKFGSEAQSAGAIIGNDLIKQAAELDDQWTKLTTTLGAQTKSAIVSGVQGIKDYFEQNKEEMLSFLQFYNDFMKQITALLPGINKIAGNGLDDFLMRNSKLAQDAGINDITKGSKLPGATNSGKTTVLPERGAGGGSDPFERQVNSINRHIAALQADAAAVGLSDGAHAQLRSEMQLLEAARKDDASITDAQIAAFARLRAEMTAQQALQAAGINLTGTQAASFLSLSDRVLQAASSAAVAKDRFKELMNDSREFGSALSDAFKGMVLEGKKLDEVLRNLLNRLASRSIDKLFDLLFSAPFGGGASPFLKLLGFGGARAGGGPVSAGQAYVVGENRPELFVPSQNGTIIPNVPRSVGGSAFTFSPVTSIDARGSSMTEAQFKAILHANNVEQQRQLKAALPSWQREQALLGG